MRTVFVNANADKGLKVKGGRIREGDRFRDRVGVGDEAYVWAILENIIELRDKCYWGNDNWYERWRKWGIYVYRARNDEGKTEVEEEAWKVHH